MLLIGVKTAITALFLLFFVIEFYAASPQAWDGQRQIWFKAPAKESRYGLPVGNGRLGAMVLGTYPRERIQLNEDSIWAKEPMLRHPETRFAIIINLSGLKIEPKAGEIT